VTSEPPRSPEPPEPPESPDAPRRVELPDGEWQKRLDSETYRVTRRKGTERAFTGQYWNSGAPGLYRCACCDTPLFASDTKYDSGTGWPSFADVVDPAHVREEDDHSLFRKRTEVLCAVCDAHLGHVFPDGPEPTGLRYCINSVSLRHTPDEG